MKILIISHEYPPVGGGGANACMYLARQYAMAGHEVHIITVWFDGLPENETISDYVEHIYINRLPAKRASKEHCGFAEMLDFLIKARTCADRKVASVIRENRPFDICQIFFGIPSGPVGLYLKRKYSLPYVIRFGGGDIPGFQDRFAFVYKLIGPAIKLIWKRADALVANSAGLKSLAQDFCDRYPIRVFPNGVDTDTFCPLNDRDFSNDHIEILFVSRLIERKGLQYVIPYLHEIETSSGRKIHLTIVGDGPYRGTLQTMAEESDVSSMITFEGQKDKSELLPYYQSGDIFVFPSKKEGMSNAVLEAMACGLPIVMSPCQGSSELIDGNGVISDPDLTKFKKTLIDAISAGNEELKRMSDCSRQRAQNLFSWKSVAERYMFLFESIRSGGKS